MTEEAKYSFDPLHHLSVIAPYFESRDPPLSPDPPQGCTAERAAYLVRHGAIYTNDYDYNSYIKPFTDKLGNTTDVTTGSFNENGQPGVQNFYRYDLERSVQPTDIPHRVVGNLNYTLPFGHGESFGANIPGWANQLAGGWKLNFIGYVQSGYALGITQTGGPAYSGGRPSFVAGTNPLTSGSTHRNVVRGFQCSFSYCMSSCERSLP